MQSAEREVENTEFNRNPKKTTPRLLILKPMKTLLNILSITSLAVAQGHAAIIWNAGGVDNAQQYTWTNLGPGGGGANVRFTQENNGPTPLPGNPANLGGANGDPLRDIDDDYYFAGVYNTTVGNAYPGVGIVGNNEESMERAWTVGDPNLRFHFNFPGTVTASDLLRIDFGITGMESIANAQGWDVTVKLNGVTIYTQPVANVANADFMSPTFNLATVNGMVGSGFDNYVELTGTSRNPAAPGSGGSRWLSLDYVQMDVSPVPEPTSFGFLALAAGGLLLVRRRRK